MDRATGQELIKRKVQLERNLQNNIQAELNSFYQDTGLHLKEIAVPMLRLHTIKDSKDGYALGPVTCEVDL